MRKSILLMLTYINLTLLLSFPATSLIAQTDFWEQINTGLTPIELAGVVQDFAINNSGDIFAGTLGNATTGAGGGVFRSTDNGDNWTLINTGLTNPFVFALAINNSGDIFAGALASATFSLRGGAFRSSDNGDNWSPINTGLTTTSVLAFAINSSGDIFAGTRDGVFRSTDNGDNWSPINTGLTNTFVLALAINSSGDIFAGTNGGGVFRHVESPTAVEEISTRIPSSFALEQNYPNPFNPSTTIQFALAKRSHVTLKLFDIRGREVSTLLDETLAPGSHKVVFEAKGLSSGVYFYRIAAGEFVETKKLALLK